MKESCIYHGHSIDLHLSDIVCGRVRWTYFIDKLYCFQGATDTLLVEAVRTETLALAHRSIDVLDSMNPVRGLARISRATGAEPAMTDHGVQRLAKGPSRSVTKR